MREKNVIDEGKLRQRQVGNAGPGVDENVVVEEHGRGAQVASPYPAAASKDPELHRSVPMPISRRTPSRRPIRAEGGPGAFRPLLSSTSHRVRIRDSSAVG